MLKPLIFGALGLGIILVAGGAQAGDLEIAVSNVTQARGHVRVDVCTEATFAKDKATCAYSGAAPAQVGVTLVRIAHVQPGRYAAQVFHDLTDQRVVHQNFLGVPKEPIGFSNDASVHFSGPKFKDAAFSVGQEPTAIKLKLRKIMGGQ